MTVERNDKGQILINIEEAAAENLPASAYPFNKRPEGFSRYNGGWIKQVTGIDKTKTDGYSILGPFAKAQKTWNNPGLYLDCSISGSRKNQTKYYHLFILNEDGTITRVGDELKGSLGWAVELWDSITNALNSIKAGPVKSELKILEEQESELIKQLEEVRAKIEALKQGA